MEGFVRTVRAEVTVRRKFSIGRPSVALSILLAAAFSLPAWPSPVVLRVVDQVGVEIPGSTLEVIGIGHVDTGSVVEIPEGPRDFLIRPGRNGADGSFRLERFDVAERQYTFYFVKLGIFHG